jgi:uncharacterized membrane protein YhhN
MGTVPISAVVVCAVFVSGLLLAEHRRAGVPRAVCKLCASSAFVVFAVSLGAATTTYGRLVLVALLLSWVGDALLLSSAERVFFGGLIAFLLAHVSYTVAFWVTGPSLLVSLPALLCVGAVGVITLRWLWPHLSAGDRPPVTAYILVIVVMCAAATGSSRAVGSLVPAVGAACFMASDVAVARDQFVVRSIANRRWGLPLYYFAQLLLAWTVTLAR